MAVHRLFEASSVTEKGNISQNFLIICSFPLTGFMTDRLHTYIPSFILAAVVEFTGAVLLLILVCDKKQKQKVNRFELEDFHSKHLGPPGLWETTV